MGYWSEAPFSNDYILDDIGGITGRGEIEARLWQMLDGGYSDYYDGVYEASAIISDSFGKTTFLTTQEKATKAYSLIKISVEDGYMSTDAYNSVYESLLTLLSACQISLNDRIRLANKALKALTSKENLGRASTYVDKMIAGLSDVVSNNDSLSNIINIDESILTRFNNIYMNRLEYNVEKDFFKLDKNNSKEGEYRLTFGKNNRSSITVGDNTFNKLKNQGKISEKLDIIECEPVFEDEKRTITVVRVDGKLYKCKTSDLFKYVFNGKVKLV